MKMVFSVIILGMLGFFAVGVGMAEAENAVWGPSVDVNRRMCGVDIHQTPPPFRRLWDSVDNRPRPNQRSPENSGYNSISLRLNKFRMLLAPFIDKLKVVCRPGKEMTNVDPLSRAQWITNPSDTNEQLDEDNSFSVGAPYVRTRPDLDSLREWWKNTITLYNRRCRPVR